MTRSVHYEGDSLVFDPIHFLQEAISDFLESGTEPSKIASAVIKVATGIELLLKDKLERICPALVLEKIDESAKSALQIAKVFDLGKHMRNPKELDTVDIKTISFISLLTRAEKFIDLAVARPYLEQLQKSRNSLVHHKGKVNMWETNLLLVKHIFPFIQSLGQTDTRIQSSFTSSTWEKIGEIERYSINALSSQLAKKIAHHERQSEKLTETETRMRIESEPEDTWEDIINPDLLCPACKNRSLTARGEFDEDADDGGFWRFYYVIMDCRVCKLELEFSEVTHILENFASFPVLRNTNQNGNKLLNLHLRTNWT